MVRSIEVTDTYLRNFDSEQQNEKEYIPSCGFLQKPDSRSVLSSKMILIVNLAHPHRSTLEDGHHLVHDPKREGF